MISPKKYNSLREFYEGEKIYLTKTDEDWIRFRLFSESVDFTNAAYADIGCAEGEYAAYARARGARMAVGVDISPAKLALGAERFSLDVCACDGGNLGLKADSFDIVSSFEMIEHTTDPRRMIGEMHRVLKQGGILLLSFPIKKFFSPRGRQADTIEEVLRDETRFYAHLNEFSSSDTAGLFKGLDGFILDKRGLQTGSGLLKGLKRIFGIDAEKIMCGRFPSLSTHIFVKFVKLSPKVPAIIYRKNGSGGVMYFGRGMGFRLHPRDKFMFDSLRRRHDVSAGTVLERVTLFPGKCLVVRDYPWWSGWAGYKGWKAFMEKNNFKTSICGPGELPLHLKKESPSITVLSGESWPGNIPSLHLSVEAQNMLVEFVSKGGLLIMDRHILHRAAGNAVLGSALGVDLAAGEYYMKDETLFTDKKISNPFGMFRKKEQFVVPSVKAGDAEILSYGMRY